MNTALFPVADTRLGYPHTLLPDSNFAVDWREANCFGLRENWTFGTLDDGFFLDDN